MVARRARPFDASARKPREFSLFPCVRRPCHVLRDGREYEEFFRPGYVGNLLMAWLPALDGVVDRLHAGARVADVGCGHGASTVLMAQEFPRSVFVGSDHHAGFRDFRMVAQTPFNRVYEARR